MHKSHFTFFGLQALREEVEGYVETIETLGTDAQKLIRDDHFDSANISARKVCAIWRKWYMCLLMMYFFPTVST